MNTMDTNTLAIAAVVIILLIAVGALLWSPKRRSARLEQRFGPEYARTVDELGSRERAETELRNRERRVQKLEIVPLAPADARYFAQEWKSLQSRFVDSPKGAVSDADALVRELMVKRGYPMADFERRAADISVGHAVVVDHYRAAQLIVQRDRRGEADTEELRRAVVHYRALFDDLLEVKRSAAQTEQQHSEVHS